MSAFIKSHPLLRVLLILLLIGAVAFLLALGALVIAEHSVPAPGGGNRYMLVLGAQVYETGEPSKQLLARLETALSYWKSHPDTVIIACGGRGEREPAAEGDVMRAWLIERGVPAEQAFSESTSVNTRENIDHARRLIEDQSESIIIVTSDYHLPRALAVARDAGLNVCGLGAPTLPEWWIKNHFREVLAWGKYFLTRIF